MSKLIKNGNGIMIVHSGTAHSKIIEYELK
jgi:hypothetical protein